MILEGFGTQVGTQNRTQIDQKSTLEAMENTTPKPIREKESWNAWGLVQKGGQGVQDPQKIIPQYLDTPKNL